MSDLISDSLQKKPIGLTDVCEVRTFRGYRKTRSGGRQEVTIEIFDAGPGAGALRYHIHARGETGSFATGNPAGEIEEALAIVHWDKLD